MLFLQPRLDQSGDWPWSGETEGGSCDPQFRYSLTTLTIPRRCVGLARRRVGRGGRWVKSVSFWRTSWIVLCVYIIIFDLFLRFLLDRAYSDSNGLFQSLDSDSESDFSFPASPLHLETTSQTVTSSSSSQSSSSSSSHTTYTDLRQILRNIKACRWRHFKPRTLTSQSGAGDALSRRPFRGVVRGGAGPGGSTLGRTAGTGPPAVGEWTRTCELWSAGTVCLLMFNSASSMKSGNKHGMIDGYYNCKSSVFAAEMLGNDIFGLSLLVPFSVGIATREVV